MRQLLARHDFGGVVERLLAGGWSVEQVARRSLLSERTVANLAAGCVRLADYDEIALFGKGLGIPAGLIGTSRCDLRHVQEVWPGGAPSFIVSGRLPDARWWRTGSLGDALRRRDFGAIFRALTSAGWSDLRIAELVGLSAERQRDVAAGRCYVTSYSETARIVDRLGAPFGPAGLSWCNRPGHPHVPGVVRGLERRLPADVRDAVVACCFVRGMSTVEAVWILRSDAVDVELADVEGVLASHGLSGSASSHSWS